MDNFNEFRENLINFYRTNQTLSYSFRLKALKRLKLLVEENLDRIFEALRLDLNKSDYEAYLTEISMVYQEINYLCRNLKHLMKPKRVRKSLITYPARGYIYPEAYGVVLIMAPFNYPLQLSLIPLAGAIAGGNVVFLKLSEDSINTSLLLIELINKYFDSSYIKAITGDKEASSQILELKFDKIFFTGSPRVGKIVLSAASKNLTPCDLELGGKSPVIVTESANLDLASKRIIWGKIINAGQTCVAPDYVLCSEAILKPLANKMEEYILKFLGSDPVNNLEYPKIINLKSYMRLKDLIKGNEIIYGGKCNDDSLRIEPTILLNPNLNSRAMTEEIFGPILPIITYKNLDEAYSFILEREKPLAFYIFSSKKEEINKFMNLSFGGAAINDTILHMTDLRLPFGGSGNSGMGSYHGKYTFKAFTREKSVLRAKGYLDLSLRYHPYEGKLKLLKRLFK